MVSTSFLSLPSGGTALRKVVLFFSLLSLSFAAFAQSNYSVLSGTVLDPQSRPLAGATLQMTSLSTRAERRVNSNEQGIFQVPALPPGEYELTVQASGFATLTRNLQLEVGQQLAMDLTLSVAGAKDVVEVGAHRPRAAFHRRRRGRSGRACFR